MKASQLVGKRVLRTKPVKYESGALDYSYTSGQPITIVKVTDSHIVYKHKMFGKEEISTLELRWLDDNWCDYDELITDYKNNN